MPPYSGSYFDLPIPADVFTMAVVLGQGTLRATFVANIVLSKIDFNLSLHSILFPNSFITGIILKVRKKENKKNSHYLSKLIIYNKRKEGNLYLYMNESFLFLILKWKINIFCYSIGH